MTSTTSPRRHTYTDSIMHISPTRVAFAVAAALAPAVAQAQVLTFEGIGDVNPVAGFYASSGITFTSNAFALVRTNLGGSGTFGGEPSPGSALFFFTDPTDPAPQPAYFNVAGGFTGGLGLFYSAPAMPGTVRIWSGLDATGTLLGTVMLGMTPNGAVTLNCPNNPGAFFCPMVAGGASFAGVAHSVDFGSVPNDFAFDNVTLGSAVPSAVPEPSAIALVATGLVAVAAGGVTRRRRAS